MARRRVDEREAREQNGRADGTVQGIEARTPPDERICHDPFAGQFLDRSFRLAIAVRPFAERLRDVRVFDVDPPATSRMKRDKLAAILGSVPPSVALVAAPAQPGRLLRKVPLSSIARLLQETDSVRHVGHVRCRMPR
jgi:hypothetical protein